MTFLHLSNNKSGFTLIELLVVIAIIGVLSSIVLASLNTSRQKARDSRRRADLRQVALALELHFDSTRTYPSTTGSWWGTCSTYGSHDINGANGWVPNLAPTHIPVLPIDPRPTGTDGCYLYRSDGANYKLLAHHTTESVCPVPATDPMYDVVRAGQCTFTLFTSGGQPW